MTRSNPFGVVYFAQAGEDGPVKIGFSSTPDVRLQDLQVASAEPLRLLRTVEGGLTVEKFLHKRFKHLAIRGEWFEFDGSMLEVEIPDALRETDRRPADNRDTDIFAGLLDRRIDELTAGLTVPHEIVARRALIDRAHAEAASARFLALQAIADGEHAAKEHRVSDVDTAISYARRFQTLAIRWNEEAERLDRGGDAGLASKAGVAADPKGRAAVPENRVGSHGRRLG